MKLMDKVAFITGAGSGIGRAIAHLFAREGARVAVIDLTTKAGLQTVKMIKESKGEAIFAQADVSKANDVKRAIKRVVKEFGKLDILVNNAGVCFVRLLANLTEQQWDKTIDVNLKGTFLCSKYASPHMKGNGGGVIINMSSGLGVYGGIGWSAYCASKGGIIALTKALAVELAPNKIRVNCILPGPVATNMLTRNTTMQAKLAGLSGPEAINEIMKQMIPLGRIATPEDMAYGALYLASDESSYVSGIELSIDGGYLAT
jgi:NAD(P)-dependent dehydrogenase (short-subunit alcohol dehydrogenase family)